MNGSLGPPIRVLVEIDHHVPAGKIAVGGARIVSAEETLGEVLSTKLVRVPDDEGAEIVRDWVSQTPGYELA